MKIRIKILVLLLVCKTTFAQNSIPILKSQLQKITIKDGWEGKTKYWNHLVKAKSPIVYHLAKNGGNREVVFYTDIDSISINIENRN